MGVRVLKIDPEIIPDLLRQPTDDARYRYEIEGLPDDARVIPSFWRVIILELESAAWSSDDDGATITPIMHTIERKEHTA